MEIRKHGDAEKALNEILKKVGNGAVLRVGFLEGATYPDGKPVALIAAIQNFGAPARGIPPRPFFDNMIANKQEEWGPASAALLKQNNFDAAKTMGQVGEVIKGQLQQSIRDTNAPALKPATVKRKGFDKPLINTSHMINSADYEVKT